MAKREIADEIIEELIEQLETGKALSEICRDPRMPNRRTVTRWMRAGGELAERLSDAAEIGFHEFAEETLRLVESCEDSQKARNIFASRAWYLGKRSRAFAEKPVVGVAMNVDAGDTFSAIARVLDQASGRISGRRTGTYIVDGEGEAGSIDARRGLAALDSSCGAGLREDENGG